MHQSVKLRLGVVFAKRSVLSEAFKRLYGVSPSVYQRKWTIGVRKWTFALFLMVDIIFSWIGYYNEVLANLHF